MARTTLSVSLVLGCLFACGGGLEPGEGPGFSIFDPALTGEELYEAIDSLGEINEDDVENGGSETVACQNGGTETLQKQATQSATSVTITYKQKFSDCGTTIAIRNQPYHVVINGNETMTMTFAESEAGLQLSGSQALSFGGDLGFSAECNASAEGTLDGGELEGHENLACQFEDSEGATLAYTENS